MLNSLRLFLFLLIVFAATLVSAQQTFDTPVGEWKSYLSHRKGLQSAIRGEYIYMISDVGLVGYHTTTKTFTYYTRKDGLSSTSPQTIFYDKSTDYVFIAYQNGMIDFFKTPEKGISTIYDIYTSKTVIIKSINCLNALGGYLYIGTAFGIVVYDINKHETRATYAKFANATAGQPVTNIAFLKDTIWVNVKNNGLYVAALSSKNLADGAEWQKRTVINSDILPENLLYTDNNLFCTYYDDSNTAYYSYMYSPQTSKWDTIRDPKINMPLKGKLKSVADVSFENRNELHLLIDIVVYRVGKDSLDMIHYIGGGANHYIYDNSGYYALSGQNSGLYVYHQEGLVANLIAQSEVSLPSNSCQDIAVGNNELYVAPKGLLGDLSCSYDNSGVYYRDLSQTTWSAATIENGGLDPLRAFNSFGRVFYDPSTSRAYVSSCYYGMVVFEHGKRVQILDNMNTCIQGISQTGDGKQQDIRIFGMKADPAGNLWLASNAASKPITVFTPDSGCYSYPLSNPSSNLMGLEIDDFGYKWFIIRKQGIVIYDDKTTINDTKDDFKRTLNTGVGSGNLQTGEVNAIKKDLSGYIWIGTTGGVTVFYSPYQALYSNDYFDGQCIVFNQRCLLKDENVTCIAVDGANRKWFGTESSGVFLINPDGSSQVLQFNTNNSPLPSNKVLDIEIEPTSGEVFFATERGIMSYRGDATSGKLNSNELYAFPNPVYHDYNGVISITGSAQAVSMRIITEAGLLVREIKSNGGQTSWDGRDYNGNRVAPGVYLALCADDKGNNAGIAKIAILPR